MYYMFVKYKIFKSNTYWFNIYWRFKPFWND